jgi:hypothetical protein
MDTSRSWASCFLSREQELSMITLWGGRVGPFCDGITRHDFLRIGGFGAFGASLTLPEILRAQAASPKRSRPRSAILIWQKGGPSHIDTFDLKPEAPVEYRGEFKPIRTSVPGVQICEHLPRLARLCDKLAVIRSLKSDGLHADHLIMSGYTRDPVNPTVINLHHHPSFGSVVSKLRNGTADVPPYVTLDELTPGQEPGFLGPAYRAFNPDGRGGGNLRLPVGVDLNRLAERRSLLADFDQVRRDIDASGNMRGLDAFTNRALDLVSSGTVRKALDLSREDPRMRDRYKGFESFLLARRLVEAGVGCVTLSYANLGSDAIGWDTHSSNFKLLRRELPKFDRAVSCLIQDLCDRGLDEDVVTVVWGEFGRSPKIGDNTPDGRAHWPDAMSAVIAGGGFRMGQVIGSTTARGEMPRDRPVTVPQVLGMLYRAMGIDPAQTLTNGSGRPVYILDDRKPVPELL